MFTRTVDYRRHQDIRSQSCIKFMKGFPQKPSILLQKRAASAGHQAECASNNRITKIGPLDLSLCNAVPTLYVPKSPHCRLKK